MDKCDCMKACTSPAKHPRTMHGLKDATGELAQIVEWWGRWPAANIGVCTGPASGIVVVDIDPRNGGMESWEALRMAEDYTHDGPAALTGGGGMHLYFAHPGQKVVSRSGELAEGVDVKGDGGYVCRIGEALTLKADLTWMPIGDLKLGDTLLAPTEDRVGTSHIGGVRQWREAVVTGTSWMESETVRVIMGSGRELICTPDHRFLASRFGKQGGAVWMEAQNLLRCSTDRRASGIAKGFPFLPRYMEPWATDRSYEAGWFAGILDGEGWTDGYRVAIAQREGIVAEKIREFLRTRHWQWSENIDKASGVVQFTPNGTKSDIMRLLGETRPSRLLSRLTASGELLQRSNYGWSGFDPVVAVEPAGKREVCILSTSTGTFIDEGYVSHNCAPPSIHARGTSYTWIEGYAPWERPPGPIPLWLLDLMRAPLTHAGGSQPVPDKITQGKRRNALLSLAGSMRHRNMGETAIFNALMAENEEKCDPPLDTREVAKIAADAASWEAGSATILPTTKPGAAGPARRAEAYIPNPMSFASLKRETIPPLRWAVEGLLPEGCAMLAGAAKLGKSYASLAICNSLATGEDVFSYFPCSEGDSLYLALEDGKRRLRDRLKELLPSGTWPERAYYENKWPRINEGGKEAMEAWLGQHPEARLVIVDTFALFKPDGAGRPSKDVYAEDYAAVRAVKDIADQYGVCIVLITHLNKGDHADWVNAMTGSTGLSGAADTLINMARPDNNRSSGNRDEAVLRLTGRDVQEGNWAMHRENGWWKVIGDMEEAADEKENNETVHFMQMLWEDGYREVDTRLMSSVTNKRGPTVRQMLSRAARADRISRVRQGWYELLPQDRSA